MRPAWLLVALVAAGCELIVHFDPPPEAGAQCSDGLDNDGDGLIDCKDPGCAGAPACAVRCGDGVVQAGEECDDGNAVEGDACDSNCTRPRCGNGIVDPPRLAVALPVAVAVAGAPSLLAVADFDGDGRQDLAVAAPGPRSSQVIVLLERGGAFAAQSPVAVAGTIAAIAAGDLDGDGRPDVAVVAGVGGTLTSLLNRDGALVAGPSAKVGAAPAGLVLVDIGGDGALDVAVANSGDGTVSILINTGDGGALRAGPTLRAEAGAGAMAAADLDGDGVPDLVVADAATGHLSLFLGLGSADSAPAAITLTVGTRPVAVAVADVSGDGRPDLVVANAGSSDLSVLVNEGKGQFTGTSVAVAAAPAALAALDLDGDGDVDLAVALAGGTLALLGNDGGEFHAAGGAVLGGDGRSLVALFADADGRLDLAVAEPAAGRVEILAGAGQTEQCDGGSDCTADCARPGGVALWAQSFGGLEDDEAADVAVDEADNVYVAGSFAGTMTLGSGAPLQSAGQRDLFVASFTSAGALRWRAAFGGAGDDFATGVAWDPARHAVIIAGGAGPATFGTTTFQQPARAFVVTVAGDSGAVLGAFDVVGPKATGSVSTVAVDARGRIVVGGRFDGAIVGGAGTVLNGPGAFLAGYGAGGAQAWIRGFTGSSANDIVRARLDGAGVTIHAVYEGALPELDLGSETSAGFVARFTLGGGGRWVVPIVAAAVTPSDLVLDGLGDAVAFGSFSGTLGTLPSAGGVDDYLLVIAPDGATIDERQLGSGADERAGAVTADARGEVVLGGAFPVAGATRGLVRFAADRATALWSQPAGFATLRLAVDGHGFVYLAGVLTTPVTLAGRNLVSNGGSDALLVKLRP